MRFLDRFPRSSMIWEEAGFIALSRNRLEEAEDRFRRAVELDPESLRARLNLANALFVLNRLVEAETEYRYFLDAKPGDAQGLFNFGLALDRMGRREEAEALWQDFLRRYPDHESAPRVQQLLSQS